MATEDSVVADERGDLLEVVFWGGVYLFTLALFAWEFGIIGVLGPDKAGKFPIAIIVDFSKSMYLTALLGGGGTVLLIILAVLRFGSGVRDESASLRPGQGTFKFMVFSLAVTVILGMTIFQGAATLAQTDEASAKEAAAQHDVPRQLDVDVLASQWFWRFDVAGIPRSQGERVVLPAKTMIHFRTTSADVIHSFAIKSLGVTKDAMPGEITEAWFYLSHVEGETTITFTTENGETRTVPADTYQVRCAELCGKGHSKMIATIYVVSVEHYEDWAHAQNGTAAFEHTGEGEGEGEGGHGGGGH